MSAKIAADSRQGAAGKSPAFLPAATKLMSAKIASCDFGQFN
jgi:hypothetical protein